MYSVFDSGSDLDSYSDSEMRTYGYGYGQYDAYDSDDIYNSDGSYSTYNPYDPRLRARHFGSLYHPDMYYQYDLHGTIS